ncbi:MAG: YfiR family protein [Calditrichaeota bacterium]|nr:MAG: YfiR family protein [Calditrichota bacterium]
MRRFQLKIWFVIFFFISAGIYPQQVDIPVKIQYPLALKILSFERALKKRIGKKLTIGIAYQEKFRGSRNIAEELQTQIANNFKIKIHGVPVTSVLINLDKTSIENALSSTDINILYVTPLRVINIQNIQKIARQKNILTLTGVSDYVEDGIMVGIGLKGGKPNIIINLKEAKTIGADFSSKLLKFSTIIDI